MFTVAQAARHHHAERDEYLLITLRAMSGTLIFDSDEALVFLVKLAFARLPACLAGSKFG